MIAEATGIWILGAGRFGRLAVERLFRTAPGKCLTVVDRSAARLKDFDSISVSCRQRDAVDFLADSLNGSDAADWIVPAVPLHVAFEWVRRKIPLDVTLQKVELFENLVHRLPNAIRGAKGTVYTSFADFICPDDCPEPAGICRLTGLPRSMPMFRLLETLATVELEPVVVRSRQLAPGVGGYRPAKLFSALKKVVGIRKTVLLATACRCHGVLETFRLVKSECLDEPP